MTVINYSSAVQGSSFYQFVFAHIRTCVFDHLHVSRDCLRLTRPLRVLLLRLLQFAVWQVEHKVQSGFVTLPALSLSLPFSSFLSLYLFGPTLGLSVLWRCACWIRHQSGSTVFSSTMSCVC